MESARSADSEQVDSLTSKVAELETKLGEARSSHDSMSKQNQMLLAHLQGFQGLFDSNQVFQGASAEQLAAFTGQFSAFSQELNALKAEREARVEEIRRENVS